LKVVAVAVVAQVVWGMARALCPDRERASIAVLATLVVFFAASSAGQIGAIVLGGALGLWLCREATASPAGALPVTVSRAVGGACLAVFFLLLAAVVPPGWVSEGAFLAGYGAAQAVPGPLFTFAAYLGAVKATVPNGVA